MRRRVVAVALLALAGLGAGVAVGGSASPPTVKASSQATLGSILVSGNGRTLYHLASERRGSIACTGACARSWPPLLVAGGVKPTAGPGALAAKLGTIKRPDGSFQVTYAGMALYRFAADTRAGSARGIEVKGWSALTPSGRIARTPGGKPIPPSPPTITTAPGETTGGGDGYYAP
jgi:predicted lipoprotein with Yx(FWY)xxD motif